MLTRRDFNITIIPIGINNWVDAYKFYDLIINQSQQAIAIVENQLLQKRQTGYIAPQYQCLINIYELAILDISFIDTSGNPIRLMIHRIALYDPRTGTFRQANSFDQLRILKSNENTWRNIT